MGSYRVVLGLIPGHLETGPAGHVAQAEAGGLRGLETPSRGKDKELRPEVGIGTGH